MSRVEDAVEIFRGGCACSQAVFATYAEDAGLDRLMAMKVSAGFAGGMRMAETCGAVTGAIMALGLKTCAEDCAEAAGRKPTFALVQELTKRFAQKNGSTLCKGLLGCDISTEAGSAEAREKELFATLCPRFVRDASVILEELTATPQS